MDALRVRMYNVLFGDAILITVPDKGPHGTTTRHILIDVGNSWNKAGGENEVFRPVVENILSELDGKGLDLYVMTHEHMDHVEGLKYADLNWYGQTLKDKLGVKHAWLTASCQDGYYDTHPKAKEQRKIMEDAYHSLTSYFAASPNDLPLGIQTLLAINDLSTTEDCVKYLSKLAPKDCTHYVYRGMDLTGLHEFQEAQFEIWAPEEDTSVYYTRALQPPALNFLPASAAQGETPARQAKVTTLVPPAGVDASAFYRLVEQRERGGTDNLMAIDKAANNTSVVFSLEWRGWRLLFPGDAEERSWQIMQSLGLASATKVLKPVDFLKVGHHGSHNATPSMEILQEIRPASDQRARIAALSTFVGDPEHPQYHGVPDPNTLERIQTCWEVKDTRGVEPGMYFDILFEG